MKDVQAFIVGVARYGMAWDADSAARNAYCVARLLCIAGVRPAHIHLFVDEEGLSGSQRARLDSAGIARLPPTAAAIAHFWRTKLPGLLTVNSKLFAYWSGHGQTDSERRRIFFCRDYSKLAIDRVFNANEFLAHLTTDGYAQCVQQMFFADVCGNYGEMLTAPTTSQAASMREVDQLSVFASPDGAYASSAEYGDFTSLLVGVLRTFRHRWPTSDQFLDQLTVAVNQSSVKPFWIQWRGKHRAIDERLVGGPQGDGPESAPEPRHVRIFLACPADVGRERELATQLINDELNFDPLIVNHLTLEIVKWERQQDPRFGSLKITPEQAVARWGPRPSACDVVVFIIWSELESHLDLSGIENADSKPYASTTEWEFEDALKKQPKRRILIYSRNGAPLFPIDHDDLLTLSEHYRQAEEFCRQVFNAHSHSSEVQVVSYERPADFADLLSKDLKILIRSYIDEVGRHIAIRRDSPTSPLWQGDPYPGLRPFKLNEAAIFFGREPEIDILIDKLRNPKQRFIAVVGSSGSGKSSLIRAGLIPALNTEALEGSKAWHKIDLTAGAGFDPLSVLAAELSRLHAVSDRPIPEQLERDLADDSRYIVSYIESLKERPTPNNTTLLFVDQFENVLATPNTSRVNKFIDVLAAAASHPRCRVLITLRSDFQPQAMEIDAIRSLLQPGIIPLGPPGPRALVDMIVKPAIRARLHVQTELVDEILADAGTTFGVLPLLAHCLAEMYKVKGDKRELTVKSYTAIERLGGAIRKRINTILSELRIFGDEQQLSDLLSPLFSLIIRVDATGLATRRWAPIKDLEALSPEISQLVVRFLHEHLLLATKADNIGVATFAHDALLLEWKPLEMWIGANKEEMQRIDRLLLGLSSRHPNDRLHAAAELGTMKRARSEVILALIDHLTNENENPAIRVSAAKSLGNLPLLGIQTTSALTRSLGDTNADVRASAASALGKLGPAAGETEPVLRQALRDKVERVRTAAAIALGNVGQELEDATITELASLLYRSEDEVEEAAVTKTLLGLGSSAAEKMMLAIIRLGTNRYANQKFSKILASASAGLGPSLVDFLGHPESGVREFVAYTLGRRKPTPQAVAALHECLGDSEGRVREEAIHAIAKIGAQLDLIEVEPITSLKDDELEGVRIGAIYALSKVKPTTHAIVDAIISLGDHSDGRVRRCAVTALGQHGSHIKEAVDAVIEALQDDSRTVQSAAITALITMGVSKDRAISELRKIGDDRDSRFGYTIKYVADQWSRHSRELSQRKSGFRVVFEEQSALSRSLGSRR